MCIMILIDKLINALTFTKNKTITIAALFIFKSGNGLELILLW